MSSAGHAQLIRGRQLVADEWCVVPLTDDSAQSATYGVDGIFSLLPLSAWIEQRNGLVAAKLSSGMRLGVWLGPADDPALIGDDLSMLDVVAVHFPKFVDGRGYSTAALLRQRYGYRGELRAFGDVGRDQLFYLARVGFDSFLISEGRDAVGALASLNDFPEVYQTACDQATPLFRRREIEAVT